MEFLVGDKVVFTPYEDMVFGYKPNMEAYNGTVTTIIGSYSEVFDEAYYISCLGVTHIVSNDVLKHYNIDKDK